MPSNDHKCWRMPRFWSLVMGLAASSLPRSASHTLSTPSRGAMNEMYLPSGDTRACVFSGLPNNAERGMTGVPATASAALGLRLRENESAEERSGHEAAGEELFHIGFPGQPGHSSDAPHSKWGHSPFPSKWGRTSCGSTHGPQSRDEPRMRRPSRPGGHAQLFQIARRAIPPAPPHHCRDRRETRRNARRSYRCAVPSSKKYAFVPSHTRSLRMR